MLNHFECPGRPKSVLTDQFMLRFEREMDQAAAEDWPETANCNSWGLTSATFHRACQKIKFHAYKPRVVQRVYSGDRQVKIITESLLN